MPLRKELLEGILRMDSILRQIDRHNKEKSQYGLSILEVRTLQHIKEEGLSNPKDLAEHFKVTPATITAQIDRLVDKGFIRREKSEKDARYINLKLTDRANNNLDEIIEDRLVSYDFIFGGLSKEQQESFLRGMKHIERYVHKKFPKI